METSNSNPNSNGAKREEGKSSKKRKVISIQVKKEMLKRVNNGEQASKLASLFGVNRSVLSRMIKNKDRISVADDSKSTVKGTSAPEFEKALALWLQQMRSHKIPVSQEMLQEKARKLSTAMVNTIPSLKNFKGSRGWVKNFLHRNPTIKQVTLHGEGGSANQKSIEEGRIFLQAQLAKWSMKDVFNMDETALFYRLLPNQTLGTEGERGTKKDKTRVTLLLCCNADGSEKLRPLIIGRYQNPRPQNQKPQMRV
jgi:hypothetical protein